MKSAAIESETQEAIAVVAPENRLYRIIDDEKFYEVRANCQGSGAFMQGLNRKLSDKIEFILTAAVPYWGDLGMTQQSAWIQLQYIPLPNCGLPRTLCVTYVKGESLDIFSNMRTELKSGMFKTHPDAPELEADDLSEGVVTARFEARTGENKSWSVVRFGFRNFASDEEVSYAKRAIAYAQEKQMLDIRGTRDMVAIKPFIREFGEEAFQSLVGLRAAHGLSLASALRVIKDGEAVDAVLKELAPAQSATQPTA